MPDTINFQQFRRRLSDVVRLIGVPHGEPEVLNWSRTVDFDTEYRELMQYLRLTANFDAQQTVPEPTASSFRKFEGNYVVRGHDSVLRIRSYHP